MAPLTSYPPLTQVELVTDVVHGVSIPDPYRWLEDQNSSRTRKWLEEQSAYTRRYLDAVPNRERIRGRIQELLSIETISVPSKVGSRYFFLKRRASQEQPVITMREGMTGVDTPLIDPAEMSRGSATSVCILNISKDGKILAYGIRHRGEDSHTVEFLEINSRRMLPDRLSNGFYGGLVFSPDGRGFYYSHTPADSRRPHYKTVRWHTFGTVWEEDLETFVVGEDPRLLKNVHPQDAY